MLLTSYVLFVTIKRAELCFKHGVLIRVARRCQVSVASVELVSSIVPMSDRRTLSGPGQALDCFPFDTRTESKHLFEATPKSAKTKNRTIILTMQFFVASMLVTSYNLKAQHLCKHNTKKKELRFLIFCHYKVQNKPLTSPFLKILRLSYEIQPGHVT